MDDLFKDQHLLPDFIRHRLGEGNPWWSGRPAKPQPAFKRWPFEQILKSFERKLTPVVLLRGPRRVGKTTLQSQVIENLLASGQARPSEIMHVQFDELPDWPAFRKFSRSPILDISYWFEENILRMPFNQLARSGRTAYLFFDEVQNFPDWAGQVKSLVDHADVRVLRAALPPYSSSNGRDVLPTADFWKGLAEHGGKHRAARDQAFRWFSQRGGYPLAQERARTSPGTSSRKSCATPSSTASFKRT